MVDAIELALYFIREILKLIPDSPYMFIFALAIVMVVMRGIYNFTKI